MRKLEFIDAQDGATLPGDPRTLEGVTAILEWFCPSLTRKEAQLAAEVAMYRHLPANRDTLIAFLCELFERE